MFKRIVQIDQKSILYISFLIIFAALYSQTVKSAISLDTVKATCAGIEVMGVDHELAEQIRKLSTLQIGDTLMLSEYDGYCKGTTKQIENNLTVGEVKCSYMVLSNGEFYLVLDILPIDAKGLIYRTIPYNPKGVVKLPEQVLFLYNSLFNRSFELLSNYTNYEEYYDKGYLDYDDPVLHSIAEQLSVLAKKHNDDLLKIIHYSPDRDEREAAGLLLSWSQEPNNLRYIADADLLLDPDNAVRNNVARSYIHFMDRVKDKTILTDIIPAYCKMAALPLHSDRNKALYCILEILKAHPDMAYAINVDCKNNITYIADMSVLDSVGGVAKEIVKLMEEAEGA